MCCYHISSFGAMAPREDEPTNERRRERKDEDDMGPSRSQIGRGRNEAWLNEHNRHPSVGFAEK